ncbi:DUF3597 domain-containing protein [Rhizobium sp. SYY.PMSO]|uniref:DUF3597 domain-containing protein n=1 Tax=Rhizobium sp. SYY.PMSO TaxID=3382192 RepID=UPI00398FA78E
MGIFSSIKTAIFGEAKAQTVQAAPDAAVPTAFDPANDTAAASASVPSTVDVESILDNAVRTSGQKLDWKHSIVDLLKALNIDSSLAARKELASELGYGGDTSDSAAMNVWLHKAVIKKLSENGGKVPADLLD